MKSDGTCGIIDGQHRAASIVLLAASEKWDIHKRNILVDVFEVSTDKEIDCLFREINSGEPVRLVDMPGELLAADRKALDDAVAILVEKNSAMFKLSPNCRLPHLHADTFRDDIYQSDMLERHSLNSNEKLVAYLNMCNEKLGKRTDAQWIKVVGSTVANVKAIKKARDHNFYLGLEKSWMNE